ncbi:MAG: hypothetical protein AAFU73_09650 [Planctomycetota bacterium]
MAARSASHRAVLGAWVARACAAALLVSAGAAQDAIVSVRGTVFGNPGSLGVPALAPLIPGDAIHVLFCFDGAGTPIAGGGFLHTPVPERTEIRSPYGTVPADLAGSGVPLVLQRSAAQHVLSCQASFEGGVNVFTSALDDSLTLLPTDVLLDLIGQSTDATQLSGFRLLTLSEGATQVDCMLETIEFQPCGLAQSTYCTANANSTGVTGGILGIGSNDVADNDVTLIASDLPAGAFGIFLASRSQGFIANVGGGAGNLCLGGSVGRYAQILQVAPDGRMEFPLDLDRTPQPSGLVAVVPGESWYFQAWHRDAGSSNLTVGLEVEFD